MIRVEITRGDIASLGKNALREVGRLAMYEAAEYWFRVYLPLHFQNIAYRRYKYKFRDKRTDAIKRVRGEFLPDVAGSGGRAIGEVKPLVFTGQSRDTALKTKSISTKAPNFEKYTAKVAINARVFNYSRGKRIDMVDEVTRSTPQEDRTLEKIFAAAWEKQMVARGRRAPKRTKRTAA